jgi:hypothetical protein
MNLTNAFASLPVETLDAVVSCYREQRALGMTHADARAVALAYLSA